MPSDSLQRVDPRYSLPHPSSRCSSSDAVSGHLTSSDGGHLISVHANATYEHHPADSQPYPGHGFCPSPISARKHTRTRSCGSNSISTISSGGNTTYHAMRADRGSSSGSVSSWYTEKALQSAMGSISNGKPPLGPARPQASPSSAASKLPGLQRSRTQTSSSLPGDSPPGPRALAKASSSKSAAGSCSINFSNTSNSNSSSATTTNDPWDGAFKGVSDPRELALLLEGLEGPCTPPRSPRSPLAAAPSCCNPLTPTPPATPQDGATVWPVTPVEPASVAAAAGVQVGARGGHAAFSGGGGGGGGGYGRLGSSWLRAVTSTISPDLELVCGKLAPLGADGAVLGSGKVAAGNNGKGERGSEGAAAEGKSQSDRGAARAAQAASAKQLMLEQCGGGGGGGDAVAVVQIGDHAARLAGTATAAPSTPVPPTPVPAESTAPWNAVSEAPSPIASPAPPPARPSEDEEAVPSSEERGQQQEAHKPLQQQQQQQERLSTRGPEERAGGTCVVEPSDGSCRLPVEAWRPLRERVQWYLPSPAGAVLPTPGNALVVAVG